MWICVSSSTVRLLTFLFPHFPFNVFTSYLIILPHRKRQTFICIFLVNIHTPQYKTYSLNGVHSAMNLELCSLTQSLAHAPIFLPFVTMPICVHFIRSRVRVCDCFFFLLLSLSLSGKLFFQQFSVGEDSNSSIGRRKKKCKRWASNERK